MFKLFCTFLAWFVGGLLALAGLFALVKPGAWVFLVALGVLIAAVTPWQKRWQAERAQRRQAEQR